MQITLKQLYKILLVTCHHSLSSLLYGLRVLRSHGIPAASLHDCVQSDNPPEDYVLLASMGR